MTIRVYIDPVIIHPNYIGCRYGIVHAELLQRTQGKPSKGGGRPDGSISIPISGRLDDRTNVKKNPRPFEEIPEDVRKLLLSRNRERAPPSVIEVLQEKHVMSAIVYIDRMSPVMKSDVYSDISRSTGMSSKIDSLYRLGIIDIYSTVNKAEILVITQKGKKIAQLIREMIDKVESADPSE